MYFGEINNTNQKLKFFKDSETISEFDYSNFDDLFTKLSSFSEGKLIAVGLINFDDENRLKFGSRIWLELDIVPVTLVGEGTISNYFDEQGIVKINLDENNKVLVDDLVNVDSYEYPDIELLKQSTQEDKVVFISATPRGGGVALMRHSMMRLVKQLKFNWNWHILEPDLEVFNITKRKFHNILQNVADPSIEFTDDDRNLYESWIERNYKILKPIISDADIIVIEDPQPSGLIKFIRKDIPNCRIIYRSHIQIDTDKLLEEDSVNSKVWSYLWENIQHAEKFISHPIEHFVPYNVPKEKVIEISATTDPLDGLNKQIDDDKQEYYFDWFNRFLKDSNFEPLDTEEDYIIQVARFDPSKGINDVLESYRLLSEKLKSENKSIPQLVIAGHGSIDDPDGVPIYNMVMSILEQENYSEIRSKIKVARLPHSDQLLNVLLRNAKIALQLSHKEGFEIKVTESLIKGVPVIAYRAGGIPLQIINDTSGVLIENIGDIKAVEDHLYNLLVDSDYYERLSNGAMTQSRKDLFTLDNILRWTNVFR